MIYQLSIPEYILALSLIVGNFAALFFRNQLILFCALTAVALGLASDHLSLVGLLHLSLFSFAFLGYFKQTCSTFLRLSMLCVLAAYSFFTYIHFMPGFSNYLWINNFRLSTDSTLYRSFINIDKCLLGMSLLMIMKNVGNRERPNSMAFSLQSKWVICLLTILAMITIALLTHFVRFDPKLPLLTLPWLIINCALTVIPEETFYRGFFQNELLQILSRFRYGQYIAIFFSSILFGLQHVFSGGPAMVLFASIVGVGYGLIGASSWGLYGAVALHMALNTVHFIFFSYPALLH